MDPPDNDGIEIPINERAFEDPSAEGRKPIWELYSGLVRKKADTMAKARTTIKLITMIIRRFHRNKRNLSNHISFSLTRALSDAPDSLSEDFVYYIISEKKYYMDRLPRLYRAFKKKPEKPIVLI